MRDNFVARTVDAGERKKEAEMTKAERSKIMREMQTYRKTKRGGQNGGRPAACRNCRLPDCKSCQRRGLSRP